MIVAIRDIFIKENPYLAKVVDPSNTAEYDACLRLRHDYFVKKRHWVTSPHPDKEYDHYDLYCIHLAVFQTTPNTANENTNTTTPELLAYMRLLPWTQHTNGFMLENEFSCLLTEQDKQNITRENSAELSRLVLAPDAIKCDKSHTMLFPFNGTDGSAFATDNISQVNGKSPSVREAHTSKLNVLQLLFKLMYQVSLRQGINYYYIVAEACLFRTLRHKFGFPFQALGQAYTFPDGTRTRAALANVSDLEDKLAGDASQKLAWYRD